MFSARLFLYFRRSARQFTMKTSAQKKQTYSLVGSGSHESLCSNDSRRLYDERPVGRSRRSPTADASRLSAGLRAKKPSVDPTSVSDRHRKQTDTQSMPSDLSVVRGRPTNAKLSSMKRMRFSFAGPMLDLLPLEIISVVLNIHSTGTEVALIRRYTLATTLSIGNEDWCFSQNLSGSSSSSAGTLSDR